jgi:chaperonin GroEL (HSP60 family)
LHFAPELTIEIVKKAITWPARQIAINAGEDGSVVVGKILENDTYAYGFDAQTGEFGNLVTKEIDRFRGEGHRKRRCVAGE